MSDELLHCDPRLTWLEIEARRVEQIERPDVEEYDSPMAVSNVVPRTGWFIDDLELDLELEDDGERYSTIGTIVRCYALALETQP